MRRICKGIIELMEEGNYSDALDLMDYESITPEEIQAEIEEVKCQSCRNRGRDCTYCNFADFMDTDFEN